MRLASMLDQGKKADSGMEEERRWLEADTRGPAGKMAVGAERMADVEDTSEMLVAAHSQAERPMRQNHMRVAD